MQILSDFGKPLLALLILFAVLAAISGSFLTSSTHGLIRESFLDRMKSAATAVGQQAGQVAIDSADRQLTKIATAASAAHDMRIVIINAQGVAVADSDDLLTGKSMLDFADVEMARREGYGLSEISRSATSSAVASVAVPFYLSDTPLETSATDPPPAGVVRVSATNEVLARHSTTIESWLMKFFLAAALLLATFWLWSMSRILRPVPAFAAAIKTVGEGTYKSTAAPRQTIPPWDQLGDAFEEMGSKVSWREKKLLHHSKDLEAVLSSMIEGVLAMDSAGKITQANDAACQMLSLSRENVIGRPLIEVVRFPELNAAIEQAKQTRTRIEQEFQTLTEPRRTICARISLTDDPHQPTVAVVMHDVTNIRQLENMRRDFVANVSHELKTPLSVIKAYAETLKLGAIDDQERNQEFVEQIESQADLLDRQIQDLLQLARVESGKSVFEIVDVNIHDACHECHRYLKAVAQRREIKFQIEPGDEHLTVRADFEAITTILKNLISNAIQYTHAGGSVVVRGWRSDGEVNIEVSDTGIGISPPEQARIFERFYRADKARSRDMGGTGLGLAIVKHLTTAFGGRVSLESKVGKGSKFRVSFPEVASDSADRF